MKIAALAVFILQVSATEPITYAEILTFQDDSNLNVTEFGSWQAPHGGLLYCAAPVQKPGSERRDVWSVGLNCCADGAFTCFDSDVYQAAPNQDAATRPDNTKKIGLKVDRIERENFLKAARKSPVWWQGRRDWSPDPVVVYLVPSAVQHCAQTELPECGPGRNRDSCPPPIDKAFNLACPGLAKCYRNWDPKLDTFHHSCVTRPFKSRYLAEDPNDAPAWWKPFKSSNSDHPAGPDAEEYRAPYPHWEKGLEIARPEPQPEQRTGWSPPRPLHPVWGPYATADTKDHSDGGITGHAHAAVVAAEIRKPLLRRTT